ncbi:hypothetical protein [Paenibacillus sp. RC67]|uniref:hypothetical protein n=1 Tax=Paenibacillus sp. RC67 TaxID=3039392 RepID=UPI0024AD3D18|nr:hypothetical protein [Paenibacillus sp. RC67]
MSRFEEWDTKPIYDTAERWKECLLDGDSLLWPGEKVWTLANVESFMEALGSPDGSDADFFTKLKAQLQGKPRGVSQLACEVLLVYYLFPRKIKGDTKRAALKMVVEWSDEVTLEDHNPVLQALEWGIGATGTAYNTRRYYEVLFILSFSRVMLEKPMEESRALLNNHLQVRTVLDSTKGTSNPMSRHILLHLLFPDSYERISSQSQKLKIRNAFEKFMGNEPLPAYVDDALYAIRGKLESLLPQSPVDFYRTPVKECWESGVVTIQEAAINRILQGQCRFSLDEAKLHRLLEAFQTYRNNQAINYEIQLRKPIEHVLDQIRQIMNAMEEDPEQAREDLKNLFADKDKSVTAILDNLLSSQYNQRQTFKAMLDVLPTERFRELFSALHELGVTQEVREQFSEYYTSLYKQGKINAGSKNAPLITPQLMGMLLCDPSEEPHILYLPTKYFQLISVLGIPYPNDVLERYHLSSSIAAEILRFAKNYHYPVEDQVDVYLLVHSFQPDWLADEERGGYMWKRI